MKWKLGLKFVKEYEVFAKSKGCKLTTGLKRPPLIRKNVHAVIAKLNPAARAMYNNCSGVCNLVAVETSAPCFWFEDALAVSTPANANTRKTMVPRNSPITATT